MKVKLTIQTDSNGLKVSAKIDTKLHKVIKQLSYPDNISYNSLYFHSFMQYENYPNFVSRILYMNKKLNYDNNYPNMTPLLVDGNDHAEISVRFSGLVSDDSVKKYVADFNIYLKKFIEEIVKPFILTEKYIIKKGSHLEGVNVVNKEGYSKHWYGYFKNYKKYILPVEVKAK